MEVDALTSARAVLPSAACEALADDETIEQLAEHILSLAWHERVPRCCELCNHPDRKVRNCAIQVLRSLGPGALSTSSVGSMLAILEGSTSSWGARASALDVLRLHPRRLLLAHASAIGRLVSHPLWCCRAVGMEALELLDADGLLHIAEPVLRALPDLEWTLCAVRATHPQEASSPVF